MTAIDIAIIVALVAALVTLVCLVFDWYSCLVLAACVVVPVVVVGLIATAVMAL